MSSVFADQGRYILGTLTFCFKLVTAATGYEHCDVTAAESKKCHVVDHETAVFIITFEAAEASQGSGDACCLTVSAVREHPTDGEKVMYAPVKTCKPAFIVCCSASALLEWPKDLTTFTCESSVNGLTDVLSSSFQGLCDEEPYVVTADSSSDRGLIANSLETDGICTALDGFSVEPLCTCDPSNQTGTLYMTHDVVLDAGCEASVETGFDVESLAAYLL